MQETQSTLQSASWLKACLHNEMLLPEGLNQALRWMEFSDNSTIIVWGSVLPLPARNQACLRQMIHHPPSASATDAGMMILRTSSALHKLLRQPDQCGMQLLFDKS